MRRENRPAMIISSTSWTADEDFGILLVALEKLDRETSSLSETEFPNLLVVVTGKGPQKEMYLERIKLLAFKRIRIATMYVMAMMNTSSISVSRDLTTAGGWRRVITHRCWEAPIWVCACTPRPLAWIFP